MIWKWLSHRKTAAYKALHKNLPRPLETCFMPHLQIGLMVCFALKRLRRLARWFMLLWLAKPLTLRGRVQNRRPTRRCNLNFYRRLTIKIFVNVRLAEPAIVARINFILFLNIFIGQQRFCANPKNSKAENFKIIPSQNNFFTHEVNRLIAQVR